MSADSNEQHLMEIAKQLSCPNGEKGLKTAANMAMNNGQMTALAVHALQLQSTDTVLEIGPGNASHVAGILKNSKHLLYYGVDISELMVTEAIKLNEAVVATGQADFSLSDGEQLNFADDFFSKIFTVNTLYFWKNPDKYVKEISRVLKPGGVFSLAFAPRTFMETLAFTKYNFQLYSSAEACDLLKNNGFNIVLVDSSTEKVRSNAGMEVNREVIIVMAVKPAV